MPWRGARPGQGLEGVEGERLRGGCRAHLAGGTRVGVWWWGSSLELGSAWGASGLGIGDLGSGCDQEHVAWASACLDRTSSSALWAGRPLCARPLTSAVTTPGASRPRTRLVLRPRSQSVAKEAGTKDPPAPPLPQ